MNKSQKIKTVKELESERTGNLVPHQFFYDSKELDRLYELAPKYVKRKGLPVTKHRSAAFVMRMILIEGLDKIDKELNGEKLNDRSND